MGAWAETVMSNDYVLDEMIDLVKMNKDGIREKVQEYLTEQRRDYARYDCNRLFGAELVDISINGMDDSILGGTYDYEEFFNGLKGTLDDLKDKALEAVNIAKKDSVNWVHTDRRLKVINKIEHRLKGIPSPES